MDVDRLKKLTGAVRTGGKGTVRRKKKAVHKPAATDDKRLQNTLKRLGVNVIPGIEEVMIMKEEGSVIHFTNPKGLWQGGPGGPSPESLERLKGMMSAAGGMPGIPEGRTEEDDDEDVPDLVEGQFGDD